MASLRESQANTRFCEYCSPRGNGKTECWHLGAGHSVLGTTRTHSEHGTATPLILNFCVIFTVMFCVFSSRIKYLIMLESSLSEPFLLYICDSDFEEAEIETKTLCNHYV